MYIITRSRIQTFAKTYPDSRNALENWYRLIKGTNYESFDALKAHFRSADYVDGLIVFNIGGNKYRLIAAIHFNRGKVYIRDILTHSEYDRGKWRQN